MTGIYFNTDWQVEMFKRGKGNRHDTSYALISIYSFPYIFSKICCSYILESTT